MTKDEVQCGLREILTGTSKHGLEMFTCLKEPEKLVIKRFSITDDLRNRVSNNLDKAIEGMFLSEETVIDSSENIADNKNVLYEIIQDDKYQPFTFLKAYNSVTEYYDATEDRSHLLGFMVRLNMNEKAVWVYQHVYSASRIDRSRNILAFFNNHKIYDEIKRDVVQINSRVDFLIMGDSIFSSKIELLQKYFEFEKYIRSGAKRTIELISRMDIVTDLGKFFALESKVKLTNAKKLLKASNSPVLKMDGHILIERLKRHPRYSQMFKFQDKHIIIESQKAASSFIKMLNDDIVRSELTGQEYDSSSKLRLEPI